MYCPNCKQEFNGKFCPECGAPMIEKPIAEGIPQINLGDANAISGGLNVNASKNIHSEDHSIHNISNTSSTVNNITQVAAQKSEMELLQERKTLFLNACRRAYEDNVLEQDEMLELERLRMELGLDQASAEKILDQVHQLVARHAQKTELTGIAKIKLKQLSESLQKNEMAALIRQIDGLEALAGKFANEELQRKYYLVLAALKHEVCIQKMESSRVDNYWLSFWGCLAYQKAGNTGKAEELLYALDDKFPQYPEDNATLLSVACACMRQEREEAAELLQELSGEYTPALQRFVESIYLLLDAETAQEMGATEQGCAFYLTHFFGRNLAEEEAKREAEAQRKAAEEEELRKAEEAQRKAAEEEFMLVLDGAQAGPFTKAQLQDLALSGVLTCQTYVWKQGMANWELAENLPEMKTLLNPLSQEPQETEVASFMLVINGQQAGPYDKKQLQQLVKEGVLTPQTYVWKQGMANWEFAANVNELQTVLAVAAEQPAVKVQTESVKIGDANAATLRSNDDDALAALCEDIIGSDYIETLHLNRSWVLPQFVDMGYNHGENKKFDRLNYSTSFLSLNYQKHWEILVRNYKALAAMKDKSSYAYKIRSGWWTQKVAIAMAEADLDGFKNFVNGLHVYDNSNAGKYVRIPYMRRVNRDVRENYFYVDTPKKAPRMGWGAINKKERNLPSLYEQMESGIRLIKKAKNDRELYEAVKQYNDRRFTSDMHFICLADGFMDAYQGDGAYSAMMTMVKYLGLRFKGANGAELNRDECIQQIVSKVLDSEFNACEVLDFCIEKFFDSGVFKYKEYKK